MPLIIKVFGWEITRQAFISSAHISTGMKTPWTTLNARS